MSPSETATVPSTAPTPVPTPTVTSAGGGARSYVALFASEQRLIFRRARTWVLLAVLAAVPVLVGVAVKLSNNQGGPGLIGQVAGNGMFLAVAALGVSLPFFLPTAVAVIAGESLAGETSLGTLRAVLTAPAGRSRLLAAKMLALATFCLVAVFVVWLSGLVSGLALFPAGRVTLLSGDTVGLGDGLLRALGCALVVGLSLLGLAAIGLFVSSMTSTPLAAMAVTFGSFVILGILDAIPQIAWLHPWLLPDKWTSFVDLLRTPPYWHTIGINLLVQAVYAVVAYLAAWARFTTRDIT